MSNTSLRESLEEAMSALKLTLPEQVAALQFAVAAQAHNATDFDAVARLGASMLEAEQHRRTVMNKNANLAPSERLSLALSEIEVLKANAIQVGGRGTNAVVGAAPIMSNATALQSRVTALEAENQELRQKNAKLTVGGGVNAVLTETEAKLGHLNVSLITVTNERDSLRTKIASLETAAGSYTATLGPQLRHAHSVITSVHAFVSTLKIRNMTEEAAARKGLTQTAESVTSQRDAYKRALMSISELLEGATNSVTSGNLTERARAIIAKGGSK